MSVAHGVALRDCLILAADSTLCIDPARSKKSVMCSKVANYRAKGGNLLIAHVGEWVITETDIAFERAVREWNASDAPIEDLCEAVEQQVATPRTQASGNEFFAGATTSINLTEFLIGYVTAGSAPSLWYVASKKVMPIEAGTVRVIGGDPDRIRRLTSRAPEAAPSAAAHVLKESREAVSLCRSSACDFPIQLVVVTGPRDRDIRREFYDASGTRLAPPRIRFTLPPQFDLTTTRG